MKKIINIIIPLILIIVLTSCSKKPEPSPYYFYIENLKGTDIVDEKVMYYSEVREVSMYGNESTLLKELEKYKWYSSTAYDKDKGKLYYTNLTFDFVGELYEYDIESKISSLLPLGTIDSASKINVVEDGIFFLAYDRDSEELFSKPYFLDTSNYEGNYIPWGNNEKEITDVYQNVYTDDFVMLARTNDDNESPTYYIYSYEHFNTATKEVYKLNDLTDVDLLLLKEGMIISGKDETDTLVFRKLKYETQEVEEFPLEIKDFRWFVGTNPQESHLYYINNSEQLIDLNLSSKKVNVICEDASTAKIQKTNITPQE